MSNGYGSSWDAKQDRLQEKADEHTEPCPTCGKPRPVCPECRGTGTIVKHESRSATPPYYSDGMLTIGHAPCPRGCPQAVVTM